MKRTVFVARLRQKHRINNPCNLRQKKQSMGFNSGVTNRSRRATFIHKPIGQEHPSFCADRPVGPVGKCGDTRILGGLSMLFIHLMHAFIFSVAFAR